MAAAYVSRLQAVATRSAEVLRSRVVPSVKASYADLISKNAGARARAGAPQRGAHAAAQHPRVCRGARAADRMRAVRD
jgi:hypothetical protein